MCLPAPFPALPTSHFYCFDSVGPSLQCQGHQNLKRERKREGGGWGLGGGALLCSRLAPPLPSGAEDLVVGVKVLEAKYALHLGEARWVPNGMDCGQLSHDGS